MSQNATGKIYRCSIDGACYQDRETVMAHMKMQHNIVNPNPSYVREKVLGGAE